MPAHRMKVDEYDDGVHDGFSNMCGYLWVK